MLSIEQVDTAYCINKLLKLLPSDEARLEFKEKCFDGICRYCGHVTDSCNCTRDE